MNKRLTNEEFLERVSRLQPNIEILDVYITGATKMRVRCKRCGREWESTGVCLSRGSGCIKCTTVDRSAKYHITTDQFKEKLFKISPNIEVVGEYKSTTDKVHVKCLICNHEWLSLPSNLLGGHGCRECMRRNTSIRCRFSHEKFVEKLSTIHPDIKCADKYTSSMTHMQFMCSRGHIFVARPDHILRPASGCPVCSESYGEQKIRLFLENKGITFDAQKCFKDCADVNLLPFDFYIPSLNIAIEYDGQQHYVPIGHFGGADRLETIRQHDTIKTNYCVDNNITLIRIPYWDFDNIDVVLTNIISSQQRSQL